MNRILVIVLLFLSALIINSCSIQKRRYRNGIHISKFPIGLAHSKKHSEKTPSCDTLNVCKNNFSLIHSQEVQQSNSTINDHQFVDELIHKSQQKKSVRINRSLDFSTVNKLKNIVNHKVIGLKKHEIQKATTFNYDWLTILTISALIVGAVIVFQVIEGSTGLLIGFGLIVIAIVIFAT